MVITKDIYDLDLLKEGMRVTDFLRNSSSSIYLEELKKMKLITIDPNQRVYLTGKGQVARKMGMEKFVELEEFEKELTSENPRKIYLQNFVFLVLVCILNLVLLSIIVYTNMQTY